MTITAEQGIDILAQAQRVFDERGWVQGEEICKTGAVCAVGALQIALGAEVHAHAFPTGEVRFYLAAPGQGEWPKPVNIPSLPRFEDPKTGTFDHAGYYASPEYQEYSKYQDARDAWHAARYDWLMDSGYEHLEKLLDEAAYELAVERGLIDTEKWDRVDLGVVGLNDHNSWGNEQIVRDVFERAASKLAEEKETVSV